MTSEHTKTPNELAEDRTEFATKRTLMAMDRTLMAWMRTALSMISFGFTIYKILQGLQEGDGTLAHGYSPRSVGLFLTGLGTAAIVAGAIEYWQRIGELREITSVKTWRPSLVMALIMSATGMFIFLSIVFRQG